MDLKFEINLKLLTTVAVADSLWNREEIVNKTKIYLCSPSEYYQEGMWDVLTDQVVNLVRPESLPDILYADVVCVVESLGERKKEWFEYCTRRNIFRDLPRDELYENYHKSVYWTYYATIDEDKTIRSWFCNPKCNLWKVYVMASCFCSEELVKEIWVEVKKKYKDEDFEMLHLNYGWHMAAYWDRFFSDNLDDFICDLCCDFWEEEFYNEEKSIAENMFKLALYRGFKKPAEKFWFELTDKEKFEYEYHYFADSYNRPTYYLKDQLFEIFIFHINHARNKLRDLISKLNFIWEDTVLLHVTCWPWVTFLLPFIKRSKNFFNFIEYALLFDCLIEKNKRFCHPKKDSIFGRELIRLFKIMEVDYKELLGSEISSLFSCWDVKTLKHILNDKDLDKKRSNVINYGWEKFEAFVKEENQEMIKEFIDLIIPTKWEKNIRLTMRLIYQHILKSEFDLADKLLQSISHSEAEMNDFKNAINDNIISRHFIIKNRLDLADKFIFWKFNSEESIKNFKKSFSYGKFSLNHILNLWNANSDNLEEAKRLSNNFLNWFLNSEDLIINWKKNHFKVEYGQDDVIKFLLRKENFKVTDELLEWFRVTKDMMDRGRFKNGDWLTWNTKFLLRKNDWELADAQLNWLFDSNEKEKYMEEFMAFKPAEWNCKYFISITCSSKMFEPKLSLEEVENKMKDFIKFWMGPVIKNKQHNLRKALQDWPDSFSKIVKREQTLRLGSVSDDEFGDYDNRYRFFDEMYCDENNLKIFLELLKTFDDNYVENCD